MTIKYFCSIILLFTCWSVSLNAQSFTRADSLRGSLNEFRDWFDVQAYDIEVDFDIENQTIRGVNRMEFEVLRAAKKMQIDLFENMRLDSVVFNHSQLPFQKEGNIRWITFDQALPIGNQTIALHFSGKPTIAKKAPWDGGFVWKEDSYGNPWVGLACEGTGASLWLPNKDHLSDEPERLRFTGIVPNELQFISNGQLVDTKKISTTKTAYTWEVKNPINNYNISVNIADYAHFGESYKTVSEEDLSLDYFVLREHESLAREHFKQVKGVLKAFEHYLGPYPFIEDGYKLVETPYLGMEHQSCIAYGNQYMSGYMGYMIPEYMKWDYIIVHESGHEYFGNNISCRDHAEMWIHESFCTYSEALYVEYHYGYQGVVDYLDMQRSFIVNAKPIIGPMGVNYDDWGNSDHYYKGSLILHTLRMALNNDDVWFAMLKNMQQKFRHSQVDTDDIIAFMNSETGLNWSNILHHYLLKPHLPKLEIRTKKKGASQVLKYRWKSVDDSFDLPIFLSVNGEKVWLKPTTDWQKQTVNAGSVELEKSTFLIDLIML